MVNRLMPRLVDIFKQGETKDRRDREYAGILGTWSNIGVNIMFFDTKWRITTTSIQSANELFRVTEHKRSKLACDRQMGHGSPAGTVADACGEVPGVACIKL
ncbi:hypothetical protein AX774_g5182 [Zancudomyces culisetae]|uniref:Uncharacterized protein n=1 Tax=Zancudomyces culisetae TaxID=1213189 RepID=A0A1R1PK80_ZANCU|nr:hypothetical protein AX774_g5182 [Zancudomyces culisetae]|eukprot:OMH81364.1 hypothetical protein AX774_g5182 [Zancudomyces culisetae]